MQSPRKRKPKLPASKLQKQPAKKEPANVAQEPVQVPRSLGAIAEETFRSVGAGSLMPHNYLSLPANKYPPLLVRILHTIPGAYSEFIGRIMAGASIRSAAMLLAADYRTFEGWLREGADDYFAERDTYCSRLLQDMRIAVAHCTANVEIAAANNPKLIRYWLERGPGRQFHSDTGLWQPPAKQQLDQQGDDNPLEPLPLVDTSTAPSHIPQDSVLGDAIKHLEALNISTSPEFTKQLKEQYRLSGGSTPDAPTPSQD